MLFDEWQVVINKKKQEVVDYNVTREYTNFLKFIRKFSTSYKFKFSI